LSSPVRPLYDILSALIVDTVVSLYGLPDLGKPTILAAARNAHAFAVTSYTPVTKVSKSQNAAVVGGEEAVAKASVRRDLIVIGCRKKVLVYGAGKSIKDPWVRVQTFLLFSILETASPYRNV